MRFAAAQIRRIAVGVAAGLVIALGVAACDGDEEAIEGAAPAVTAPEEAGADVGAEDAAASQEEGAGGAETDRNAIRATLETVLTAGDAGEACGELVTKRYLRRSFGDEAGCRAAQTGAMPADRVRVSRVVILPDSVAQAQARPKGGVHDGQVLRAELVHDGGSWRLDLLRSNVPVGP